MSHIAFLALDNSMLKRVQKLYKAYHGDIHIEKGLLNEGVHVASSLVAKGTEIIITRGGTAVAIKDAKLQVTLVEIPVTGFDIIRAVEKAKLHGCCIGVVAFPSMIQGINCLGPILGVNLRLYPIHKEPEAETQVLQAFRDGVDVVIGGYITIQIAQKHHYPSELIESGEEALILAAEEAKRIAHALSLEKTKTSLFQAVLDYAYDGILSVDSGCRITSFNPIAEGLTAIHRKDVMGKNISQFWPELNLEQVIQSGEDELGQLLSINKVDVLCNKIAINVDNDTKGAVVTFQDVTQIQQMEARIRRRIHASGHVASLTFDDITGNSAVIKQAINMAKNFSLANSSILILGESGVGKEIFAQSIHNYSERRQGPFVAINCAALASQILESELFGYVGGAFTGANPKGKLGLFEIAHGGTIFLDEISEMEYSLQGKLLRILQEKKIMRLGSDSVIPVDVRIIAASNRNLKDLVNENKFRKDLYYRLNVLQLRIPTLRDRKEDIQPLAEFFLKKNAGITKRQLRLSPSAIQALTHYSWPGNIRELQNIMERVIAVYHYEIIDATTINLMLFDPQESDVLAGIIPNDLEQISKALASANGKYAEAAKTLGISRSTLWRKLKRLGLK